MAKALLILSLILFSLQGFSQKNEPYINNQTYTFKEALHAYNELAMKNSELCQIQQFGSSDYGIPVPLFIINANGIFTKEEYQSKTVLLINNAIHPGEPCGVDASIKLVKELLADKKRIPKNVIIAIIPIYNIGGAHNRGCCSRANQNGPQEYGFRGNAKNLDLNRDFIKADSKNTLAFYQIFHLLKPAVFIDTHTSNGADYQHTMTLITSQLNKMNPELASYTKETLNPFLFEKMAEENYPMVPYMHTIKEIPNNGIMDYLETPRYSTGYTNLFNTISYVTEAHMLKPYKDRVESTYLFLSHMIDFMEANHKSIRTIRKDATEALLKEPFHTIKWELDTTRFDTIAFSGYSAEYKTSKVTGIDRLFYNRNKPFDMYIKYYNQYKSTVVVEAPEYYVFPQAWEIIAKRLIANDITVYQFNKPTSLNVEMYEVLNYETRKTPYEGHYLHSNIEVDKMNKDIAYRPGDFVVPVKNENIRFIIETLEPHAPDSYFAWNYFDAILQQKEWFSAYVFEDQAAEMLKNDPALKAEFEQKRATDSTFAESAFSQLYFLYKKSPNYERTINQFPIVRVKESIDPSLLNRVY